MAAFGSRVHVAERDDGGHVIEIGWRLCEHRVVRVDRGDRAVAAPLVGPGAIVDDRVEDHAVVPADSEPEPRLAGPGCVFREERIELQEPAGWNREGRVVHGRDGLARLAVEDLDAGNEGSARRVSHVHDRQIRPVLLILAEAVQKTVLDRARPVGPGRREHPVPPATAGAQGSTGQEEGADRGPALEREGACERRGHGAGREVGQDDLRLIRGSLDDGWQHEPADARVSLRRTESHGCQEGAVRVHLVVDDGVGVVEGRAARALDTNRSSGGAGIEARERCLEEPSGKERDVPCFARGPAARDVREPQGDRSVVRSAGVLHRHVRSVLRALTEAGETGWPVEEAGGPEARVGEPRAARGCADGHRSRRPDEDGGRREERHAVERDAKRSANVDIQRDVQSQLPQVSNRVGNDALSVSHEQGRVRHGAAAAALRRGIPVRHGRVEISVVRIDELGREEGARLACRRHDDRDEERRALIWNRLGREPCAEGDRRESGEPQQQEPDGRLRRKRSVQAASNLDGRVSSILSRRRPDETAVRMSEGLTPIIRG